MSGAPTADVRYVADASHEAPRTKASGKARTDPRNSGARRGSHAVGAAFETRALDFLVDRGLSLVARNVRCRGGELDLVMREPDGTLVFVEVRARAGRDYGGAAASVGWRKRNRLLCAARHFLAARVDAAMPPCRFDVVAFEGWRPVWLRDAFRADDR
ncbi:YraN family protein [Burkholderia sp. WAC0059]|uniref:YraN family protein n=1 Tax=Burkholderia sp. WAC0059 TaxID=2066022 RepID=UPI0021557F15|nr:YraN family protein [Burkholderia sp. WAC0059]